MNESLAAAGELIARRVRDKRHDLPRTNAVARAYAGLAPGEDYDVRPVFALANAIMRSAEAARHCIGTGRPSEQQERDSDQIRAELTAVAAILATDAPGSSALERQKSRPSAVERALKYKQVCREIRLQVAAAAESATRGDGPPLCGGWRSQGSAGQGAAGQDNRAA